MSNISKKHIMEFDEKCKSCRGTGVYVGMAERDGWSVVCHTCKGTGCYHVKFEYEDFEGKSHTSKVTKVLQNNPGFMVGGNLDFGGMEYEDWFAGKPFPKKSEMRNYVCPAWWYQITDYKKKPNWDECIGIGAFRNCSSFKNKENCWVKWDKENP